MDCKHEFQWGLVQREHCKKCSTTLYEQDLQQQLHAANSRIAKLERVVEAAREEVGSCSFAPYQKEVAVCYLCDTEEICKALADLEAAP